MERIRLTVFVAAVYLLAANTGTAEAARLPGFEECVLNDHHYTIGEKFHPVIDVNGTLYEAVCFNCTCLPSAIAQCDQVICPPADCPNPIRFAGQCCDICIPPPTLQPDDSCLYHGIQIDSGDIFRPTDIIEDFQMHNNSVRDECIECRCERGDVNCYDASNKCPALACNDSDATYEPGKCCKQCPVTPPTPVFGEGCYDFNGQFILEGEWWHPTLPEYGLVECVNCTCTSRIDAVEFAREMLNVDAIRHRTLFHGARGCLALRCLPVGPTIPLKMSLSAAHGADPIPQLLTPSDSPVILSNDTSMNTTTTPVITPDITPCESPFIYKIYTHVNYDTLALHNLETSTVEIYNWTTMVGSEGPVVERDFFTLQSDRICSVKQRRIHLPRLDNRQKSKRSHE
ncbi:Chordin [Geodia barretti]|uniref:Chordin n=1 Tax=Geodia barretti TaxID=519541 RepID=A0AA35SW54_GEOBA|nr:Chordin [Geodia barretti]